ncbi:MAG: PEGA domain-containing protein [Acidobacteriota bacterium]|nr:PEGA domain-containing protein [Acidobacteriota bacterium]
MSAAGYDGGIPHYADTANSFPVPLPGTLDVSDPNDLLVRQAHGSTIHIPYSRIRFFSYAADTSRPLKGKSHGLLTIGYLDGPALAHNLVLQIASNRAEAAVRDLEEQTGFKAGTEPRLAPSLAPSGVNAVPFDIPAGTKVNCRLEQSLSSAVDDSGQPVKLSVSEDVVVGDLVAIPQGSEVVGTVVQSIGTWRTGEMGKLDFSIDKVEAADGRYIPLRYTAAKKQEPLASTGVIAGGAGVVFWPEAPFLLQHRGKDVTIQKGIVLEAFTGENHVDKAIGELPVAPEMTPCAGGQATVSISSNVVGADIEIDGSYVGSTPATQPLSAGAHKIDVKSGGQVWERNLLVQAGGTANVNAIIGEKK